MISLKYSSYGSPRRMLKITRDSSLQDPLLFYERISKRIGIHPFFFGIILLAVTPVMLLLYYFADAFLWNSTFFLRKIVALFIIWTPTWLLFLYSLTYIKEKYFQTTVLLKTIVDKNTFEKLKITFYKRKLVLGTLAVMLISWISELSYEILLVFEYEFNTSLLPTYTVFRFWPHWEGILGSLITISGVTMHIFLGADIVLLSFNWLSFPFALKEGVVSASLQDPEVLRKAGTFKQFSKNIARILILILLMLSLTSVIFVFQLAPIPPFFYLYFLGAILCSFPYIVASRLRERSFHILVDKLKRYVEESEENKAFLSAGQYSEILMDSFLQYGQMEDSYNWLLRAADNFERSGSHLQAARAYCLLGNHERASKNYHDFSEKSEGFDRRFYEACSLNEDGEALIEQGNLKEGYRKIRYAQWVFREIAESTDNEFLKDSAAYRHHECQGRLLVLEGLQMLEKVPYPKLNGIMKKLKEASKVFTEAQSSFPAIGKQAQIQIAANAEMCGFYESLVHFIGGYGTNTEMQPSITFGLKGPIPFISIHVDSEKNKKERVMFLDDCLEHLSIAANLFAKSNRKKAKLRIELGQFALYAMKCLFEEKYERASEYVSKGADIARRNFDYTVRSPIIQEQISELMQFIIFADFQFSAPRCPIVNPDYYRNCLEFEQIGDTEREVSIGEEITLPFRVTYSKCEEYLDYLSNPIKLRLELNYREGKDQFTFMIPFGEAIEETFLVSFCEHRKYIISVELIHISHDCERVVGEKQLFFACS